MNIKTGDLVTIETPNKRSGDRSFIGDVLQVVCVDGGRAVIRILNNKVFSNSNFIVLVDEYEFIKPSDSYIKALTNPNGD